MPYQHILKALVDKTPKAIGAILVDWEGEAVQEYCFCEPYEIRFVAAHKGIILTQLKELQSCANVGIIEDVVVTATDCHLLIGTIDNDYSLVMNVGRDCPVSIALHHFRNAVTVLKKEL